MSTTVSYKGSTIATLNNQTKTLTTSGTWMEADVVITDADNNYSVTLNLTGATSSATTTKVVNGGSYFTEITPTTTGYKISSITVTMGGVDITSQVFKPGVGAKAITANGTYSASSDNLSGYDTITVNVSGGGGGTPAISVVDTLDSRGGTIRTITSLDISDTTAVASDVASGKYFYTSDGTKTVGTASGGGTPSGTWELVGIGTAYIETDGSFSINDLTQPLFNGEGELWKVTYDNTSYECETIALNTTTYYLGNVNIPSGTDDGTGLPFFICDYAWGVEGTFRDKPQVATSKSIRLDNFIEETNQHTIYFEFSDNTNTTITAYYDDSFISNAITATTPTTYGSKTVTLAQLDEVTWYELASIPLNTELVDYNAITTGYYVNDNGSIETGESWTCVTDYLPIDSSMTFSFICVSWYGVGFYDSSKNRISGYISNDIPNSTVSGEYVHGTLTSSVIPSNAAYVILTGNPYSLSSNSLSLIRTA